MKIIARDKNIIFKDLARLAEHIFDLNKEFVKNETKEAAEELNEVFGDLVCDKIRQQSSVFKRKRALEKKENYVRPKTLHISKYWEQSSNTKIVELKSSTFQFVPIIQTIRSLFSSERFRDVYFSYNDLHKCQQGIYAEYCCGENFKMSSFFKNNKYELQIHL